MKPRRTYLDAAETEARVVATVPAERDAALPQGGE